VRWPGRKYANVDHVAVGPPRIFVFDSKNWSGMITIRDDVLRLSGRAREEAVAGAAEAALAIARVTSVVMPHRVLPVLCFGREEPLTGWARDVMVCSTTNVVQLLTSRPEILPPHIVREACLQLDAMFRSAPAPAMTYISRPTTPRTPARQLGQAFAPRLPASRNRSRRHRKNSGADLVKLVLCLAFLVALMTSSQLFTSLAQGFAEFLATRVTDSSNSGRPVGPPPRSERAVVVRHVDGDPLVLKGADGGSKVLSTHDTRVRLLEIDTPRASSPARRSSATAIRRRRSSSA
jgi:hypothetical protein